MVLPNWKMLVVDDDKLLCESTVESLKSIGVNADWCLDGEEALKKVVEHNKAGDDYQIILLDWKLLGMNGYEATKEIRSLDREDADIPIITMTADAFAENAKPINISEVSQILEKLIK